MRSLSTAIALPLSLCILIAFVVSVTAGADASDNKRAVRVAAWHGSGGNLLHTVKNNGQDVQLEGQGLTFTMAVEAHYDSEKDSQTAATVMTIFKVLRSVRAVICPHDVGSEADPVSYSSCAWLGHGCHLSFDFKDKKAPVVTDYIAESLEMLLEQMLPTGGMCWSASDIKTAACSGETYCEHRHRVAPHTGGATGFSSVWWSAPAEAISDDFVSLRLKSGSFTDTLPNRLRDWLSAASGDKNIKTEAASVLLVHDGNNHNVKITTTDTAIILNDVALIIPLESSTEMWVRTKVEHGLCQFQRISDNGGDGNGIESPSNAVNAVIGVRSFAHTAQLERQAQGQGFHRAIATTVQLSPAAAHLHSEKEHAEHARPSEVCTLLVTDTLPREVFVDPFQVAELHRHGDAQRILDDFVDIEVPSTSPIAGQTVVYSLPTLSITREHGAIVNVTLPVHFRYLPISPHGGYQRVPIPPPRLSLSCFESTMTNFKDKASTIDVILGTNSGPGLMEQWGGSWVPLLYKPPNAVAYPAQNQRESLTVYLEAPLGSHAHRNIVVVGTVAVTFLGAVLALIMMFLGEAPSTPPRTFNVESPLLPMGSKSHKESKD